MPYKDRSTLRAYQREWTARRRAEFMAGKSCVDCGSTDDLELDHCDKAQKVDHRIWSWSGPRRAAEIAKCVIRCDSCHNERHAAEKRQEHGQGAYKRGCRCAVCRAANAEKNRRYWERKRQGDAQDRTGVTPFAGERVSHSATSPGPLTLFDLEQAA